MRILSKTLDIENMTGKFKIFGLLVSFMVFMTVISCMDEPGFNIVWNGLEVEFEDASRPNGNIRKIVTKNNNNQVDDEFVRVNLVGAQIDEPVAVLIGIDPSSTAVEGVHFILPSKEVTIPPNSSYVDMPLEILTGNLANEETPDLVLTILDAGETKISINYHTLTVEIRLACPSDLAGTYSTVNTGTGGTVNYEVIITELEPFTYRISDITGGVYSQIYDAEDNPAVFTELCGVITFSAQSDVVFGGGDIIASGRVNADGSIRITWNKEVDEEEEEDEEEISGVTILTRLE
ncbi:MAG: DUF4843 domain-containing protein [Cyclobacteriaceae bacterium]